MTRSIFKKLLTASFLLSLNTSYASVITCLDCAGDYKLSNSSPVGNSHNDVQRAGVGIFKDYQIDEPERPNSRYAVILGHDKNKENNKFGDFWNFQAGKCDAGDKYTSVTASRELSEETGGLIKISSSEISKLSYVYSGSKQLFFLRKDDASVTNIKAACLQALNNPNLSKGEQEIDDVAAVALPDLLKAAQEINEKTLLEQDGKYLLHSRTNNIPILIDGYYMRMISNNIDVVKQIFNHLFPGANF